MNTTNTEAIMMSTHLEIDLYFKIICLENIQPIVIKVNRATSLLVIVLSSVNELKLYVAAQSKIRDYIKYHNKNLIIPKQ